VAALRPGDDPYRILGILYGADLDQIKAAHRTLAKRFHPDGSTGDEQRFLAVQEAYQLLSDPRRRREWDRRHSPTPSRAAASSTRAPRDTRSERDARPRRSERTATRAARPARAPGQRTTTWSAQHVPWWEDFHPRRGRRDDEGTTPRPRPSASPAAHPGSDPADQRDPADRDPAERHAAPTIDFDVFSRSSGAAWSAAARRHFRRDDADLPSRGAWRYRGTQVVTGAEARKVAGEEAARQAAARAREEADR
jgi:curved DNA-binding protein CbpA